MARARRICARPGCPNPSDGWLCATHEAERMAGVNAARPKRHQTYDAVWTKASKRQLRQKPWCECRDAECKCRGTHAGAQVPATDADHIVPRDAFVDPVAAHHFTNLQSLCRSCHSSKTARLDGGFGRMEAP